MKLKTLEELEFEQADPYVDGDLRSFEVRQEAIKWRTTKLTFNPKSLEEAREQNWDNHQLMIKSLDKLEKELGLE